MTYTKTVTSAAALMGAAISTAALAQEAADTPARGYLKAHEGVQDPLRLLGGPVDVTLTQDGGEVYIALPAKRALDPVVFGSPDMPLAYGGYPIIEGVPAEMRETAGGAYTQTTDMTPFGDKFIELPGAKLSVTARDATAVDAATSEDQVEMTASWEDAEGNTYEVTCCAKLETVGGQHPTFGGVVTNHLMHGFTRVGTPLFPSMFAYLGFWGAGEAKKNGEVLDGPRPMHGMWTEYARTEDYGLVFDEGVTPGKRYFHIMVPPVAPAGEGGGLEKSPVNTGFTMENGEPLPFWHVMFENAETVAQ
jgi:hypothetical protein